MHWACLAEAGDLIFTTANTSTSVWFLNVGPLRSIPQIAWLLVYHQAHHQHHHSHQQHANNQHQAVAVVAVAPVVATETGSTTVVFLVFVLGPARVVALTGPSAAGLA